MNKRYLIGLGLALSVAMTGAALADKKGGGGTGPADGPACYNQVTESCNAQHPGKNYGDADYKQCIDSGLDACDVQFPATKGQRPVFHVPKNIPIKKHPGTTEAH